MKKVIYILFLFLIAPPALRSQNIEYVDDEACGCETVFIDGIQTTQDGEFFGFKRYDGLVLTPNKYRYVDKFKNGFCRVYEDYEKCGMIDRNGNEIVPCIYDYVEYPSERLILVSKNGLFGFTDMKGNVVIQLQFQFASKFSEGRACVRMPIDDTTLACTFIDTTGEYVFPLQYRYVVPYTDGFSIVQVDSLFGIIDYNGNTRLDPIFSYITTIDKGYFFAGEEGRSALYDTSMCPLTKPIYDWSDTMSDCRIPVGRGGKYGFLDLHGNEIIPCQYDQVGHFRYGRAVVYQGEKIGIIDTMGNIVLPIEYTDKTPKGNKYVFKDSLALVEKDGKLGYINLNGELVIPFYFTEAREFSQGLAAVCMGGKWGYINTKAEIYMPFVFDAAASYEWGRADVLFNGVSMKVDLRGKCVKNCKGVIAWRNWTE